MILKTIATYAAKLTYGLFLPAYLLWFVFFSHFQYQRSEIVSQYREKMEESLELLGNLHRDETFFHALLQKNFNLADNHLEPGAALKNRLSALRKAFPGQLKFVIWNKSGQVDKNLSDENKFKYVLKTMLQVLKQIKHHYLTTSKPKPQYLKPVARKIRLLRGYFGQFLLPELMIEFFKPSYLGSAITVSELSEKSKLWVYLGNNFSVSCFINSETLNKRIGPRLLVRSFNRKSEDVKLGCLKTIDYKCSGLPPGLADVAELKLEARKFEENAISFRESRHYLIQFRQVSPDLIVLSYLKTAKRLPIPANEADKALFILLKWLVITFFVGYCFFLRNPVLYLSVQQKFLLLFLFANGLPALILVSTGYEYFNEKKASMIEEQQQESIRILKEIDARYPGVRASFSEKLNDFIDGQNKLNGNAKWSEPLLQRLKEVVVSLDPGKVFLMDKSENRLISYEKSGQVEDDEFVRLFLNRSLDFSNNSDNRRRLDSAKSTLESISSEDMVFVGFLYVLGRISRQNFGIGENWVYIKLLGDYRNFDSWGILGIVWNLEELINAFLRQNLQEIGKAVSPREVGFMEITSERVTPEKFAENSKLRRLLHQTITRKLVLDDNLVYKGHAYLFCGISGNEMQEGVLMTLYPRKLIENQVFRFKFILFFIGLIILLTLIQIIRLFSQRLLTPVEGLAEGVEAIRQRNFRYRVNFQSEDEFGQLIKAFNTTMEGLRELAIGTAVQESLLLDGHYENKKIHLFARSTFMTKMGGDYFDYFETHPGRLAIIFGDVAGHGIPAAMIMAMAKAVIASSSFRFKRPSDLLAQANLVLLFLKERKLRRMMTCQCLDLNCETGEFIIANAGQCYPVVVSHLGKTTDFVVANGMPLGNKPRKPYEEKSIKLQPGDTMILYSDGIIEAMDSREEVFDYPRFKALLQSAWDEDLELYWKNIMDGNRAWAAEQDDDLTFMIIRYEK